MHTKITYSARPHRNILKTKEKTDNQEIQFEWIYYEYNCKYTKNES